MAGPAVHLLAYTHFDHILAEQLTGWTTDTDGGQALAEYAGRACYQSWKKPNPATATNAAYLANILRQRHESVLEHATVSFYVEGVSRSMLLELERHRHLSFSVLSQRYVDESEARMVVPPALQGRPGVAAQLVQAGSVAKNVYAMLVGELQRDGLGRKEARQAARAVLPNMTETRFVVSGNLRAWRDVLRRRWHTAADEEIRRWARTTLVLLLEWFPHVFQDFPGEPFGD